MKVLWVEWDDVAVVSATNVLASEVDKVAPVPKCIDVGILVKETADFIWLSMGASRSATDKEYVYGGIEIIPKRSITKTVILKTPKKK